jgi:hypothetical protein
MPAFAFAQDMAAQENASQPPAGRYQQATVELNALYTRSQFAAEPDLYREIKQIDRSEPGFIGDWNGRVFKTFKQYSSQRQSDLVNDSRLLSNNELEAQAGENGMVSRVVLKETLQFARERFPEIDRMVKALRFEVSNSTSGENSVAEAKDDKEIIEASAAKKTIAQDKLYVKTGVRLRVESSSLGVASETEATYNSVSYFYKVNLDNQSDNSLGFTYVLGRDTYLQVERNFTGTLDPVTRDKPNRNLIQVVRKF